jgi:hypothetical protein
VIDRYGSPHSDALRIVERIRLENPDTLEDRIVAYDDKAFTKPYEIVRRFRRGAANDYELNDNTCTEGIQHLFEK